MPPHRVVVLALDGVIPFELGIAPRIFGAAYDDDGKPPYEVLTCTLDGRPVATEPGFEVAVRYDASILETAGTVVVPPSHGLCAGVLPPGAADALARVRPGTRLVSICTAAYVFAAAGLLDGRTATTHWYGAPHFQAAYPGVRVGPDVLFVDDGDILTSAGAAAGIDLCLHLVRRDHGSQAANRVARRCVVPPWREGGQAQYIRTPVPAPAPAPADNGTAPTREWALQRLGEPLQLADLAAHARMSVRTCTRRFRDEVGLTPGRWLIRQRVEHARQLLETSDLSIDRVAAVAGFGTAASMRQHLGVTLGVSPSVYRCTFRAA